MLVALSVQIMDNIIDLPFDEDNIELSQLDDENEQEEDELFGDTLVSIYQDLEDEFQNRILEASVLNSVHFSLLFIEIPSPPPEL